MGTNPLQNMLVLYTILFISAVVSHFSLFQMVWAIIPFVGGAIEANTMNFWSHVELLTSLPFCHFLFK